MVGKKRLLLVTAICFLALFGVMSSAGAANPPADCAAWSGLNSCSPQCGTDGQQQLVPVNLLTNCASSQCFSNCNPLWGNNDQQSALAGLLSKYVSAPCFSACNLEGDTNVKACVTNMLNCWRAAK